MGLSKLEGRCHRHTSQMLNGIVVGNKKEQITDINSNVDASWMSYAKLTKPNRKATYCLNSLIWYSGKGKTLGTETKSVIARGPQEGSDNKGAWGDFEVTGKSWWWWWLQNYTFVNSSNYPPKKSDYFTVWKLYLNIPDLKNEITS